MQIQTNTDRNVTGSEGLAAQANSIIEHTLARFVDQITRVEVHLSDENANKGGIDDKRCLLEARLEGLQPMAVSHDAATIEQAITGAANKLERALDSALGRLRDAERRGGA